MKITFIIGGSKKEIEYQAGDTLLDTAIKADLNPPYSCMEGVCTACLALIEEGQTDFPDDTILDESDVKLGRILTCQAKPKEGCKALTVNYDKI